MIDPIEQLLRDTFSEDAAHAPGVSGLAAAARRRSTGRRRRAQAWGASLAVTAVLAVAALATGLRPGAAADTPSTAIPAVSSTSRAVPGGWRGCDFDVVAPNSTKAPAPRPLSPTFRPMALVKCEVDFVTGADGSVVRTGVERRTDDPSAVLAIAAGLRLPDLPYVKGTGCLAYGQLSPSFVLLDAQGRAVTARVPVDGCGFFRREVWDRYRALDTRIVTSAQLSVISTAAAAKSGCQQRAELTKYLSWPASAGSQGWSGPWPFSGERVATVCVYARPSLDPKQPTGEFVSGRRLGAAARGSLVSAIEGSGPQDARCSAEASRFALVSDDRDSAVVELDGCRRAVLTVLESAHERVLRLQASPQLLRQLAAGPTG